ELLWVWRGSLRTTVRGRSWLRNRQVVGNIRRGRRAQREFNSARCIVVHGALQIELIHIYGIFSAVGRDVVQLSSGEPVIADRVARTVAQDNHNVRLRIQMIPGG